jgi:DNA mismatch repair protein MSH4
LLVKSTLALVLALLTPCSVPASYASFPVLHQLFARLGIDDNIETNMSTFAVEMSEIAYILRNIDHRSMYDIVLSTISPLLTASRAIIDELGRGTSTRDGLAVALAIAEALLSSKVSIAK